MGQGRTSYMQVCEGSKLLSLQPSKIRAGELKQYQITSRALPDPCFKPLPFRSKGLSAVVLL